jgi:LacI family transcriptional regulator
MKPQPLDSCILVLMQVRMKDIANDLGVSIVTVSKAIKGHPDIAEKTRTRILQRVKELNYRPNLTARSLVTGRSSLIGLLVPDLIHPFFTEIAKVLSGALRKKGLFLIVCSSEGDGQLEQDEIQHLQAQGLGALVVSSVQLDAVDLQKTMESGPPLILLDRYFPGFACNFVGTDDHLVGEIAIEHLISKGRRRIAHIRGPANNIGDQRCEGYLRTMAKHRMKVHEGYVVESNPYTGRRDTGEFAMKQVLALRPRPDALFCFNDTIAIGAMLAAFEAGIRVPEDMAIVGCGNYHFSDTLRVPLSSVDQNTQEIGLQLAKMIVNLLKSNASQRTRKTIVTPKLVQRASSH